MFANQVSIKDLFSSNTGFFSGNRHDGSENDSSGQSNSQFPYSQSQVDFPDSQDMYGSQPSSQKDNGTNSPSKFYQRYMSKAPFHNGRDPAQKPNNQVKPTFQQQLTANKARAKERDERDLLNGILNTVKDCSMEVKEVVSTLKEMIQSDSSANTEALTTCLKKVEANLSKNRAEFLTAVDTREESSEQIASLQEQLKERDLTIARLKEENEKVEKENQAKLLSHLESLYHDHSDKLKHTLEQLYETHQSELVKQGSVRDDHHQQLMEHQETIVNNNSLSLQKMENRIGEELSASYRKMVQEGERTQTNWNKELTHLQQQHLNHVNQLVQEQITASINGHMLALKEMMVQNWQQLQTEMAAHTENRKAIEDDVQSRYDKEVQELRRRFQQEAKQIMDSPAPASSAQDFSKTNDWYWRANEAEKSVAYPVQQTNNTIMNNNPRYMSSYNTSEEAAIPQPICLSPAINVLEPIDFSVNGLSAAKNSEPALRNMFSNSNSITTFRSPISTITKSWTSKMLFSKPSPSTVATVRPQLQSDMGIVDTAEHVAAPANNRKGVKRKPAKRGAKKKAQANYEAESQTQIQEAPAGYSLRKRNDVYETQTQNQTQTQTKQDPPLAQVSLGRPRRSRANSNTAQETQHHASYNLNPSTKRMINTPDQFEQTLSVPRQDLSYNVHAGYQNSVVVTNEGDRFGHVMHQESIAKPRKDRNAVNISEMKTPQQDFTYNVNSDYQAPTRRTRGNNQFEQPMTQGSMSQPKPRKGRSRVNSNHMDTQKQDFSQDISPMRQTPGRRISTAERFDQMMKQGSTIKQPRNSRNATKPNQRNTPKQDFSYNMNPVLQTPVGIMSEADHFEQIMQQGNVSQKAENTNRSANQASRYESMINRGTVMTQIDNAESHARHTDVFEFDSEVESPYPGPNIGRYATTYERSQIYGQSETIQSEDEASQDNSSQMSSPSLSVAEVFIKRQVRKKQKTSPICSSIICQQSCTSGDNIYTTTTSKTVIENASYQVGHGQNQAGAVIATQQAFPVQRKKRGRARRN